MSRHEKCGDCGQPIHGTYCWECAQIAAEHQASKDDA